MFHLTIPLQRNFFLTPWCTRCVCVCVCVCAWERERERERERDILSPPPKLLHLWRHNCYLNWFIWLTKCKQCQCLCCIWVQCLPHYRSKLTWVIKTANSILIIPVLHMVAAGEPANRTFQRTSDVNQSACPTLKWISEWWYCPCPCNMPCSEWTLTYNCVSDEWCHCACPVFIREQMMMYLCTWH